MSMQTTSIKITRAEFQSRADKLLAHIRQEKLSGVVLFDSYHILYYSGFSFIPTERPIAWVMNAQGEQGMFVPRLELEHAKANVQGGRVDFYLEYPDIPHPMHGFKQMLTEMGFAHSARVGGDNDGYPWILGYRGPSLTKLTGGRPIQVERVRLLDADLADVAIEGHFGLPPMATLAAEDQIFIAALRPICPR